MVMPSNLLRTLGLCLRARCLAVGESAVMDAIAHKKARVLLTASDISPHSLRRALTPLEDRGVPHISIEADKTELGRALGRNYCAMAAVTDPGFAVKILEQLGLGQEHPEAVQKLTKMKQRRAERQRLRRKP